MQDGEGGEKGGEQSGTFVEEASSYQEDHKYGARVEEGGEDAPDYRQVVHVGVFDARDRAHHPSHPPEKVEG